MINGTGRGKIIQNNNPNFVSKNGGATFNISHTNGFLKRLKNKKNQENKKKFIILTTAISAVVISGFVISF